MECKYCTLKPLLTLLHKLTTFVTFKVLLWENTAHLIPSQDGLFCNLTFHKTSSESGYTVSTTHFPWGLGLGCSFGTKKQFHTKKKIISVDSAAANAVQYCICQRIVLQMFKGCKIFQLIPLTTVNMYCISALASDNEMLQESPFIQGLMYQGLFVLYISKIGSNSMVTKCCHGLGK